MDNTGASYGLPPEGEHTYPLLPLRGLVVFPGLLTKLDVGRDKSRAAVEYAVENDKPLLLVAQRDEKVDEPLVDDLFTVGTLATVKQMIKMPGEMLRVIVEGKGRALVLSLDSDAPFATVQAESLPPRQSGGDLEMSAYLRTAHSLFGEYVKDREQVSREHQDTVADEQRPDALCDLIAAYAPLKMEDRQQLLECVDLTLRLETLCRILSREIELMGIERRIHERVKGQMDKNQRDYFLREQIKAIQKELGERESNDAEELRERAGQVPLNDEARDKVTRELARLSHMSQGSPEISVSRTYIEWILDMPWGNCTPDALDLAHARAVLDEDHFGMPKIKERILEFLAVRALKADMRGPILCLVGPPGVGKTSIARSIARALGRSFAHVSLGGVRDEAEIRGHRRTYIGAIPGRVVSAIKQAGSMNPVFLFDEIDKMSSDFRGDPASAMLEVLDGEQNSHFCDHYLEVPFDLSRVLFVMTANSLESIPRPLLDRMEVVELAGYTEEEKVQIAKRHLVPKQRAEHGLLPEQARIGERVLADIVSLYTREAGVRSLERHIGTVMRKIACRTLEEHLRGVTVTRAGLADLLGPARYTQDAARTEPEVGIVNGLAWTAVGGTTMAVEVAVMPGSGALDLTGQLGDVMKESARTALSFIRARADGYGIVDDFHKNRDLHIHVPEGAVPKDGPSAGVTLTCALVSALTGQPARQDVAMTGEVTLRGRVLPIGGVKEKVLAAHRAGMHTVLLPTGNEKDLSDIPGDIRRSLTLKLIDSVDQAITEVLVPRSCHAD